MKTVANFHNQEEARVAFSFLKSHNIDVMIGDENGLTAMPEIIMGASAYRLMVPDEQFFISQKLLEEVEGNVVTEDNVIKNEMDATKAKFPVGRLLLILGLAFGIVFYYTSGQA